MPSGLVVITRSGLENKSIPPIGVTPIMFNDVFEKVSGSALAEAAQRSPHATNINVMLSLRKDIQTSLIRYWTSRPGEQKLWCKQRRALFYVAVRDILQRRINVSFSGALGT